MPFVACAVCNLMISSEVAGARLPFPLRDVLEVCPLKTSDCSSLGVGGLHSHSHHSPTLGIWTVAIHQRATFTLQAMSLGRSEHMTPSWLPPICLTHNTTQTFLSYCGQKCSLFLPLSSFCHYTSNSSCNPLFTTVFPQAGNRQQLFCFTTSREHVSSSPIFPLKLFSLSLR